MRTPLLLRQHIDDLLRSRKEDQKDLALYCKKDKSWINKILNGHRNVQMEDLDAIAEFFGIATYQLLQPGVAPVSERRHGERRSGHDRRIGHQQREMRHVAANIKPLRPRAKPQSKQQA